MIGRLPQLSKSAVKRLKPEDLKRLETEALAHLTFCVSTEHPSHVSSSSSKPMKALCSWVGLSMPCDTEEIRLHTLNAGERPNLCWNHDASCDLSVIRRRRILSCCAWTMQNSVIGGTDVQAQLRTDSTAVKGLASRRGAGLVRHIHCPALWLRQAISRRRTRIEKQAWSTPSADAGTKAGL